MIKESKYITTRNHILKSLLFFIKINKWLPLTLMSWGVKSIKKRNLQYLMIGNAMVIMWKCTIVLILNKLWRKLLRWDLIISMLLAFWQICHWIRFLMMLRVNYLNCSLKCKSKDLNSLDLASEKIVLVWIKKFIYYTILRKIELFTKKIWIIPLFSYLLFIYGNIYSKLILYI